MRRPRPRKTPKSHTQAFTRRLTIRVILAIGAVAAASLALGSLTGGTPFVARAVAQAAQASPNARHYKATRAFVVDKQTGAVRMPTQEEVDEVVANLSTFGQQPAEGLQQSTQASGAVSVDLNGGFGGVLLARPNEDGTWETRCVFTLEEGAAFLGLVPDESR